MYRIDIFVPSEALNKVRDAVKSYAVSYNGQYKHCMSWFPVQSMYRAKEGATPYHGVVGEDTYAEEYILTFRCAVDSTKLSEIINLIKENHPYEDPSIDVVLLQSW